ncbi:hypothetical protein N2152v2_005386 [Parachlorella kessleri]
MDLRVARASQPTSATHRAGLCFELAEAPVRSPFAKPSGGRQPLFCHSQLLSLLPPIPGLSPATKPQSGHSLPLAPAQPLQQGTHQHAQEAGKSSTHVHSSFGQGGRISAPATLRDAVLPDSQGAAEPPNLAVRIGSMLQPQGETQCDRTWGERVINVVTSLPFSVVGLHMLSQRESREGRHHASSLVAVGLTAAIYHASTGSFRKIARKADYWTIAYSASQMVKALYPDNSWVSRAANASLLAVPFKPFVVSSAHAAVLEYEYFRQARANKVLRKDLLLHASTAALGTAAFFLEDPLKEVGFEHMHSIWHCLAGFGTATMGGLLAHKEWQHLSGGNGSSRGQGRQRQPKRGGLGLPTHSSASSLMDLQHGGSHTAKAVKGSRFAGATR